MIRRFRVKVDGRTYDVEVEELGQGTGTSDQKNPAGAPNSNPVRGNPSGGVRAAAPVSGPGQVFSPIPGKVLDVPVKTGQTVARGDTLMVIESMKIENPILSPSDGTVEEIKVSKGSQVRTGDLLAVVFFFAPGASVPQFACQFPVHFDRQILHRCPDRQHKRIFHVRFFSRLLGEYTNDLQSFKNPSRHLL